MWEWLVSLFGGGGGDAAAAGTPTGLEGLSNVPTGTADAASFYPSAATAGSAGGGGGWLGLGALGLQGASLGAGLAQGAPQTPQMPASMMFGSPASPGVDPQALRTRMAQSQSAGLAGASPDFLAAQLGLTPDELTQIMGWGGQSATLAGGQRG